MFYEKLVRPILFRCDPEEIHDKVLLNLRHIGNTPILRSVVKGLCAVDDKRLEQKLFDLTFPNPVGLAAGMDKACDTLAAFEMLGFGFVEGGGITAMKQEGNPKPRLFRVPEDGALINRMGFNNHGAEETTYLLSSARKPTVPRGINIGLSKAVAATIGDIKAVTADYCYTVKLLDEFADFFVVNVSSPNTPNLRSLQGKEFLKTLLAGIQKQNLKMPRRPHQRLKPVLLKIAPDLTFEEIDEILGVVMEIGIDGIVATNTTTMRYDLQTTGDVIKQTGGMSGKPLRKRSLEVVSHIHKQRPSLPIVGVGGIFCGEDAYEMLLAGASLVQIYTGLVYGGPLLPRRINKELLSLLERDKFKSISELTAIVSRV